MASRETWTMHQGKKTASRHRKSLPYLLQENKLVTLAATHTLKATTNALRPPAHPPTTLSAKDDSCLTDWLSHRTEQRDEAPYGHRSLLCGGYDASTVDRSISEARQSLNLKRVKSMMNTLYRTSCSISHTWLSGRLRIAGPSRTAGELGMPCAQHGRTAAHAPPRPGALPEPAAQQQ